MEKRNPTKHSIWQPTQTRRLMPQHPLKTVKFSSTESSSQHSPKLNAQKSRILPKCSQEEIVCQKIEPDEIDSDFEFSAEIMNCNPHNKTREVKERERLVSLIEFDWLSRTSCTLKLPKEVYYNAVSILRRFIILKQKTKTPPLTASNIRLYDLATLSIANKLDCIGGGFLRVSNLLLTEPMGLSIPKDKIIQCEIQIAQTLKFCIPTKSYITQCLTLIARDWNVFHEEKRQMYKLMQFDLTEEEYKEFPGKPQIPYFRVFLYLVDFVIMRALGSISLKDIALLNQHSWYQKYILNVIYHLQCSSLHNVSKRMMINLMKEFTTKISPKLIYSDSICQMSHILQKKINHIYGAFKIYEYQKQMEENAVIVNISTQTNLDRRQTAIMQEVPPKIVETKLIAEEPKDPKNYWRQLQMRSPYECEILKIKTVIDSQNYVPLIHKTQYKDLKVLFEERPCLF